MKKLGILKNLIVKNILSALAITFFGFILLNLTFIFDFIFQSLIDRFAGLFTLVDFNVVWGWFPVLKHTFFVIIIGLISFFIFKSKLNLFYKAIYSVVPLAVVFATIGIFLYRWPVAVYLIGGLFFAGILYYLYKTEKSWLYYYALALISLAMLIVSTLGVEI